MVESACLGVDVATLQCESCGAAVEMAATRLSTTCAFCDSPLVKSEKSSEPVDLVVPFDVARDRAGRLIEKWLASAWLAPESIRKATKPEELDQVLVPFYAYDARTDTQYSAQVGIYWYRTETYTVTVNGKTEVRTRQVRETDWHGMNGTHGTRWFDHLVSASKGLPEREANELEPYDMGRALPYAPALVAGVPAEIPTVDHSEAESVALRELAQREKQRIQAVMLPGDTYSGVSVETQADLERIRLVLLPVWTAVYQGPKGAVRVLVNGQTGEVVGDLPRSPWKIAGLVLVVLVILGGFLAMFLGCGGFLSLVGAAR